ncbi:hypothetical protein DZC75_18625 [Pseudomonas parafulva]|uniref:Uncharacterized protein n=1 Tax=Pseudomonas parafulva TaxID=157782 RepID=A0AAI8KE50_9PSED|nr:hypothetical protein DZC75_18625 [Pseudomonas parafulva]
MRQCSLEIAGAALRPFSRRKAAPTQPARCQTDWEIIERKGLMARLSCSISGISQTQPARCQTDWEIIER